VGTATSTSTAGISRALSRYGWVEATLRLRRICV
jgi:hypothetical protein